ncbi:MAG: CDP-alcohol phosphatidyltransferase family protein [Candidatus Omnitrophica bacterium]|nr:CDP-alcohol phosphatidyltransferase family protein [Candidatus Omnitrophota bacterium]
MNIANKVSTFRILSVPFFVASLVYYSPQRSYLRFIALGIFMLGVVSDAVDGYIARRAKQVSCAGMILDPLGDKLLLMSAFICLSGISKMPFSFPLWVTLVVISRDAIILLGTLVIYLVRQNLDIYPTKLGKITTISQMAAVISVLLQLSFSFIFWWVAVVFTVVSGFDYIKRGFKILYGTDNHRNHS